MTPEKRASKLASPIDDYLRTQIAEAIRAAEKEVEARGYARGVVQGSSPCTCRTRCAVNRPCACIRCLAAEAEKGGGK